MKHFIYIVLAALVSFSAEAQNSLYMSATDSVNMESDRTTNDFKTGSPYVTKFKVDAPIIAAGVGLTLVGVNLIDKKDPLSEEKLATMSKEDIPAFDRGNAGYYSESADRASYIPFDASFTMPVIMMLVNKNERHHTGQVLVMYTETMAITGTLFTLSAGLVDRSRPLVYGTNAPLDKRLDANSQRSFFAGHTAATAAATFFMAKVFSDFNPDSKAKPYIWTVAAAVPAVVGYYRYKAGMHFLSDNVIGYVIGAGAGILVPQLHKKKIMSNITMAPLIGTEFQGMALTYHF